MSKHQCNFCQKETSWKQEKDTTPQGYPMEIEVCDGCGVRVLTNDPQADFVAAGGEIEPEHIMPE